MEKKKNKEQVLSKTADTILQEPRKVTVDIIHASWLDKLLMKAGLKKRKKVFEVSPICIGSLVRISKRLLAIGIRKDTTGFEKFLSAMDSNGEVIAEVIAIGLNNLRRDPTEKEVRFILDNFSPTEMLTVLSVIVDQMNVQSFMSSIISVRGLNILDFQTASATSVNGKEVSP